MIIKQIVSAPRIESDISDGVSSVSSYTEIYGLSDEGKLYKWGRKKVGNPNEYEIDEETGKLIRFIYLEGWLLEVDDIDK